LFWIVVQRHSVNWSQLAGPPWRLPFAGGADSPERDKDLIINRLIIDILTWIIPTQDLPGERSFDRA
jgi:hypothetical protein